MHYKMFPSEESVAYFHFYVYPVTNCTLHSSKILE